MKMRLVRSVARSMGTVLVSTLLVLAGLSVPIGAASASAVGGPATSGAPTAVSAVTLPSSIQTFVGNADGSIMYSATSPQAQAIIASMNGKPLPVAVSAPPLTDPTVIAPQPFVTVGAGWYLYIYLNTADVNYLATLTAGGVTTAICYFAGVVTLVGSLACGVIGSVVWSVVTSFAPISRPGYCLQLKFNWGIFNLAGEQWVRRNC